MAETTRCEINPYAAPAVEPEIFEPIALLEKPIHLRGCLTISHADREFRLVLGRDVWFLRCLGAAALILAAYWLWQFWMAGKPIPVGRTCLCLTVGPLVLLLDWVACATNRLAVLMGKLPAVQQLEWIVRNDGIVTVDATGQFLRPWYEFDEVVSDHELIVIRKRNSRGVRSVSIPANACADFEEWQRLRSFVANEVKL
jgi:hypothetical protein